MEFIDLKSQQKVIRKKLIIGFLKYLMKADTFLEQEVSELESKLSTFSGSKFSLGCSNGTDALMLALMALGIGRNDGVITVPFTYIATLEAIAAVGAVPVLIDVYDSTFNMNPELIEKAIKDSDVEIKGYYAC